MKYRWVILIAIVNFILMSSIFQIFRINDTLANTALILAVIFAILYSEKHGYLMVLISGALQDIFLGKILVVNVLVYIIVLYLVIRVSRILFKGNFLTPIFVMAIATIAYHFFFYFIMFFLQSTIPIAFLWEKITTEIILNCLIGTVIYSRYYKKTFGYRLGDFNA